MAGLLPSEGKLRGSPANILGDAFARRRSAAKFPPQPVAPAAFSRGEFLRATASRRINTGRAPRARAPRASSQKVSNSCGFARSDGPRQRAMSTGSPRSFSPPRHAQKFRDSCRRNRIASRVATIVARVIRAARARLVDDCIAPRDRGRSMRRVRAERRHMHVACRARVRCAHARSSAQVIRSRKSRQRLGKGHRHPDSATRGEIDRFGWFGCANERRRWVSSRRHAPGCRASARAVDDNEEQCLTRSPGVWLAPARCGASIAAPRSRAWRRASPGDRRRARHCARWCGSRWS
jgi:hypothetical protein